jgi:hypothetical protein
MFNQVHSALLTKAAAAAGAAAAAAAVAAAAAAARLMCGGVNKIYCKQTLILYFVGALEQIWSWKSHTKRNKNKRWLRSWSKDEEQEKEQT